MAREVDTSTLDRILRRSAARIIDVIQEATSSNTIITTLSKDVQHPHPGEFLFEVTIAHEIRFDDGIFTGAGKNSLNTQAQLMITIHSSAQLDKQGSDELYLTHHDRGIIPIITKVLDAFGDHELLDEEGNELLSQPLRPVSVEIPPKDDRKRGVVTVMFDLVFDWYMPTPDPPAPA